MSLVVISSNNDECLTNWLLILILQADNNINICNVQMIVNLLQQFRQLDVRLSMQEGTELATTCVNNPPKDTSTKGSCCSSSLLLIIPGSNLRRVEHDFASHLIDLRVWVILSIVIGQIIILIYKLVVQVVITNRHKSFVFIVTHRQRTK